MRRHDGERHQFFRLVARVSEHQPLVACPTCDHALIDVRTLARQVDGHLTIVRGKATGGIGVANSQNGFTDKLLNVRLGRGGDFTHDVNGVVLHHGFARHMTLRVGGEDGIENGVGNLIANFVGVSFSYGFRGKQIVIFRLAQSRASFFSIKKIRVGTNYHRSTR